MSLTYTNDTDTDLTNTTDSETAIVPISETTPLPIQPQKCEHTKEIIDIKGNEYIQKCKICTTQYKNGGLSFTGNSKNCSVEPNDPKPIITSKSSRIPKEIKDSEGTFDVKTPESSDKIIKMSPNGSYDTKKYFEKYFYIRQNK